MRRRRRQWNRRGAQRTHRRIDVERIRRRRRRVHGLRTVPDAQQVGAGRGRRRCRMAVRRRGAGRRRGCARRALRRAGGRLLDNMLAALIHRARPQRLHRQRAQMPAAQQPHARAARGRRLPTVSRAAGRADSAEADRGAGQERRVAAARHRCDHRQPARPRPPFSRRSARRDVPSGIPVAQPAGQGEGMGGHAACAADRRRVRS